MGRVKLDIGDPDVPVVDLPDGRLREVRENYTGGHSHGGHYARYALGTAVLVALLALARSTVMTLASSRGWAITPTDRRPVSAFDDGLRTGTRIM
jgi:hypothetical protein